MMMMMMVVLGLVVSTSTVSCMESLISDISCYVEKDVELFSFI